MSHRTVIEAYYSDIDNLVDLLGKLVNSYRLLIGGADELNKIAFASKSDIKDALDRADDLGDIIDDVIKNIDVICGNYINYLKIKTEVMKTEINAQSVISEINEELKRKE
ncbi:hypothetical protein CLTEP_13590 [Clostridium tepidiprofundi DSM 19306]|uniref:Uncharacterized protein n=1 Tax=Clostridium tepidiprofundi DSM 19306 TaxID=1121338 RepID=A0A151B4F4_9CLOT|nr:hypothetical protein [Clostridium tepidiprofundi]KYH34642.1 hypothetical protein CLTEP_13590 [Clostridium tepidiprofundi DSM 19306]